MGQFGLLILSIASLHLITILKVDYNQMAILVIILLILSAQLFTNMLVFCLFKERHTALLLTSHLRTEIVTIGINARL